VITCPVIQSIYYCYKSYCHHQNITLQQTTSLWSTMSNKCVHFRQHNISYSVYEQLILSNSGQHSKTQCHLQIYISAQRTITVIHASSTISIRYSVSTTRFTFISISTFFVCARRTGYTFINPFLLTRWTDSYVTAIRPNDFSLSSRCVFSEILSFTYQFFSM